MLMKRVLVALVLVANPLMAGAPSDAQRIEEATAALPQDLRAGAGVLVTDDDGSQRTLREGRNGFVCFPDDGEPGFKTACVEPSVLRFVAGLGPIMEQATSVTDRRARIDAAFEDGSLVPPEPGSRTYILSGPDRERAELLMGIFLPGATAESTGLPTERSDGTWLMCPGSPGAHIMVGDIPYGQDEELWKTCGR